MISTEDLWDRCVERWMLGKNKILEKEKKIKVSNPEKGYLRETGKDERGILVSETVKGRMLHSGVFLHPQQSSAQRIFCYFVSVSPPRVLPSQSFSYKKKGEVLLISFWLQFGGSYINPPFSSPYPCPPCM